MRIVFFGTPEMAAIVLDMVMGAHDVVAAFSRPDAIRGRGKTLKPSAVKALCEDAGIPIHTPQNLKDPQVIEQVARLEPDVICVIAYGSLIPVEILEIPRYGCVNIHTSLLPRWRGAAPIERALLAGDRVTGVSLMQMDQGLDTGPYSFVEAIEIGDKALVELQHDLAILGAKLLLSLLDKLPQGTVQWTKQPDDGITYAAKIQKRELFLDAHDDAQSIVRKIRASSSSHASKAMVACKGVTLEEVALVCDESIQLICKDLLPGDARYVNKRLILATVDGLVEVLKLRPDGKQSMDAKAFCAGIPQAKNELLRWGSYE